MHFMNSIHGPVEAKKRAIFRAVEQHARPPCSSICAFAFRYGGHAWMSIADSWVLIPVISDVGLVIIGHCGSTGFQA